MCEPTGLPLPRLLHPSFHPPVASGFCLTVALEVAILPLRNPWLRWEQTQLPSSFETT